jgi:RNA polymerase sigma factor (sigma-70 family)
MLSTRDQNILSLERRVRYIATQMWLNLPRHLELKDLISEGWIGAMHAVDHWDESRNIKLASFADRRIRGAIIDHLRRIDFATRLARLEYKAAVVLAAKAGTCPPAPLCVFIPLRWVKGFADKTAIAGIKAFEVRAELSARIRLARLTRQEREVIRRSCIEEESSTTLAKDLGLHATRISQIRISAVAKMHNAAAC